MAIRLFGKKKLIKYENQVDEVVVEGNLRVVGTSTLPGIASPTVTASAADFTTGRDAVVVRDVLVGRNLTIESSATPVLTVRDTTGPVAGTIVASNSNFTVGSSTAHSTVIQANGSAALTIASSGAAEFAAALNVVGALTADAAITAVGDITGDGLIGVTLVTSGLATVDDLTVTDDVIIGGTTDATGLVTVVDLTATGDVIVGGTLDVTGLVSAVDITTSDDLIVGDDLTVTGLATVGETLAVTGNTTVGGTLAVTGAATFTLGVQTAAVARTATADGLTTGAIAAGTRFVAVTSATAASVITLPTAVVGNVIDGWVGANGFELQTPDASNATINTVDCDGANEAAIPASTHWRATCVAASTWVLVAWTALGAVITAIVPDADA